MFIDASMIVTALFVAMSLQSAFGDEQRLAVDATHIDNGFLNVKYDNKTHEVRVPREGKPFTIVGRLWADIAQTETSARPWSRELPAGQAAGIDIVSNNGNQQTIFLLRGMPFLFTAIIIHNSSDKTAEYKTIVPFSAGLEADAASLRFFGCDGLCPATQAKTSYTFLALAYPETRAGVVCGWVTNDRASGVIEGACLNGTVTFNARSEYGRLVVPAKSEAKGETLAIGAFDDALDGLDDYADATAKFNNIKLPKLPSGYCTWYHANGSDENRMARLADFCRDNKLKDFGLDVLQIDDGWQILSRDYATHRPNGPYAAGMKATADKIISDGFTAGLWLIPFGWDSKSPTFAGHQDWFVHRADGSIYSVDWAGDCLDMTHPEAKAFLHDVIKRITQEWGYKYIKIDGLWSGIAAKILYPEPTYRDDGLGDAVFHDPLKTNIEAFRDGLKAVRDAAGSETFILGCCVPQNMRSMGGSIGLVDGIRIGADIGANWDAISKCVPMTARLYFWHGKVWYNDPDCLLLRKPLTLDEARAWGSLIAISGQLNMVSEALPTLPAEKLDVVKRTMPNHGRLGRPLDLFEEPMPKIWHLKTGEGPDRRDLVGLFQWDAHAAATCALDVQKLGLPPNEQYIGFDYWENEFVAPFSTRREFDMRPGSCRVIALQKQLDHPQLISTSRHVTQGLIDVISVDWDEQANTLTGRSKVIADDPYELRICCAGHTAKSVEILEPKSGVSGELRPDNANLRVAIASKETGEIAWRILFNK